MANKVRVGTKYIFYPNFLDRTNGRTGLVPGTVVRVIDVPGCPKANTMGHCYVGDQEDGHFIGMVHTNSLYSFADKQLVIDAIRADVARCDAKSAAVCS